MGKGMGTWKGMKHQKGTGCFLSCLRKLTDAVFYLKLTKEQLITSQAAFFGKLGAR